MAEFRAANAWAVEASQMSLIALEIRSAFLAPSVAAAVAFECEMRLGLWV
jgi:hypothetical protein